MDPKAAQPPTQESTQTLVPPNPPAGTPPTPVQPASPTPTPVAPSSNSGKSSPVVKIAVVLLIFAVLAAVGYFVGVMITGQGKKATPLPKATVRATASPTISPAGSPEATGSAMPSAKPSATSTSKPSATPQL